MTTQVNWQRIRNEFQRLADVDKLRNEVQRIGSEIRKFDFQSVLSPNAKERVRTFEKRYSELMRTLHQAQRQMDREFARLMKQISTHRADVTKVVSEQKQKLERVSADFRKRFGKDVKTARSAAAKPKRRPTAKTAPRKASARRSKKV